MKERERNVSCSWTDYLLMARKIKSHMARSHQHSSMSRLHFNSYKHLTVSLIRKWYWFIKITIILFIVLAYVCFFVLESAEELRQ